MSGLERSVVLLAQLMERLEANGVVVQQFSAEDFFGENPENEDAELFEHLVQWLLDEGVIRQSDEPVNNGFGYVWYHDLVLTSLGYSLLANKVLPNLTLSQAVKEVSSGSRSYSGLGDFLGGIMGGFTKSIGNG
ncbi:MAG: hypothetical protein WBH14_01385 [Albidovulum sp.]